MSVDAILAQLRPQIRRMAYRFAPLSTDDRDDLTQVGMEAAWLAWLSFDGTGPNVDGWMMRKAKWAIIDYLRMTGPVSGWGEQRMTLQALSLDRGDGTADKVFAIADREAGPERTVLARDEADRVLAVVASLPPREAEALLAIGPGQQLAIAKRDGVGESAVSMRRAKALRLVREAA